VTTRTYHISASRPGLSSLTVVDTAITSKTQFISNVGVVTFRGEGVSPGAAQMDGFTTAYFIPNVPLAPGAAHMDGATNILAIGRVGTVQPTAANMDGATDAFFVSVNTVSGRAIMDGTTDVQYGGTWTTAGSGQMDGTSSLVFQGAVGSAPARMDGFAEVAWAGRVTGGRNTGEAHMDGRTNFDVKGIATVFVNATAEMNGMSSMLAVQSGTPLPPHGIILAAGI
jgi:hypothetical protein